ncbi:MAG TPA: sialidase family protein [Nitrososphaera sp.]
MMKQVNSRIILLLVSLALFHFVSFITYYSDNSNDYETSRKHYPYFLYPFSTINAYGSSPIEGNNNEGFTDDTASRIRFENVTNFTDNPNDSVYGQVAASENNVYVVWEESTTSDSSNNNYDIYIRKSADQGETFTKNNNNSAMDTTEVINLSNNPGFSEHPQIAAYKEKVHVAWIDDSLGNKEILFSRSIDNGTTFSEAINVSNTTNTNSHNLEISAFENDVYIVWLDEDEEENGIILFKASNDGGETFSNPITIARDVNNNDDFTLPKVAAHGDSVYIAWNVADNTQGEEMITDLLYVKSSDQGNTFSPPIKLNNNGEKVGEAQLAAYNNTVYVVWGSSPYDEVTSNLFFVRSTDNGNTFSNPTEVTNDNFENPSNVEITVVGNDNDGARSSEKSLWSSSSPSSSQQGQKEPYVYIASQVPLSDENEEIFLASSSDNGDTFSEVTFNLSNNSEFSECPSIATSENNIYVIWQDSTPGNNEVFFTKAKI